MTTRYDVPVNDIRREKRRKATQWSLAGAAAGGVAIVGGAMTGLLVLGVIGGAVFAGAGVWRGFLELTELPPMLPEYLKQHLEIRHVSERLEPSLRILPDVIDQLRDLVEVDAMLRSKASISVHRVRQWYGESVKEGRVGVFDRIQGGLRTLTGQDPLSELQYMVETIRTILDREISELTGEVLLGDSATRQDKKSLLEILKTQRQAFTQQVDSLRKVNERLRQVRESIRTLELQASNMSRLETDALRDAGGRLLESIGQDVTLLEQVLDELQRSSLGNRRQITDGKS